MKAEASSDSDLEVIYIKPAPKRPRRSSVPVVPVKLEEDASRCAQLPLAISGTGSKDFKAFCQEGHDLKLVPPPANVILNRSEYAYFNVSCDICGTQIAGDFYRCDVCKLDYCFACAKTKPPEKRRVRS